MKRKWNNQNHNQNHVEWMIENRNLPIKHDLKIDKLFQKYIDVYGSHDYITYIISLYLEPVAFVKYDKTDPNIITDLLPLFDYSFLDFYLCDRSYEDELYSYIRNIESTYDYRFMANPLFIDYKVENQDPYTKKLYQRIITLLNEGTSAVSGGNKKYIKKWDEIDVRKYETKSFEDYTYIDFYHDFLGNRSYLSKESKDLLNMNHHLSETQYFLSIFQRFIETREYHNQYIKVKSLNDIKVYLDSMLRSIHNQNTYIINEANALSHFFQNRSDYENVKGLIEHKFVFSFGAYLDPANTNVQRSFTNIFRTYYPLFVFTLLSPNVRDKYRDLYGFMDIRPVEKVRNSGVYSFLVSIIGQDDLYLHKDANNVKNLSIFFEYILSIHSIEKIISDYLYEKSLNREIEKSLDHERSYIQNIKNRVKAKKYIESIKRNATERVYKYMMDSIESYKNIFFQNYLKMFINYMMYLIYHHYPVYIPIVYKKYKIKNTYSSYPYNNTSFVNEVRSIFRKHIEMNDPEMRRILDLFGRMKLTGDFLQMLEVDQDYSVYHHPLFRQKRGYLITQDRILGSFCATVPNVNYISKATVDKNIYYFYRDH